jgi:hypothetical protein
MGKGVLTFGNDEHILAFDKEREPLAKVLADEILHATGVRLPMASGPGAPRDVVLQLDLDLKGEAHTIEAKVSVTQK